MENSSIINYAYEDINMSSISNGSDTTRSVDPTAIFGPQRDSLYIVIPITIIYSVIFVTGVLGNIFTCVVIIKNKSMHTATNYYLFSLAISDLLLLISGMPQEIYSIWSKWPYIFGHTFCVIRGLAAETSTYASVLTITLFTIERYLAICHPFVSHQMSKLSRAIKHVILLWIASFSLALPQALQFGISTHKGVAMCLQTSVIIKHSFEISTFVFFLAPMIIITLLYSLIGIRLNKTNVNKDKAEKSGIERNMRAINRVSRKNSTQSTKRVVKMLVAVVIAFFICWAPFHAQRLVAIYGTGENHRAKSPVLLSVYYFMTYMSGVLYYVSTCINPIFYHIMSHKFRDAFKVANEKCSTTLPVPPMTPVTNLDETQMGTRMNTFMQLCCQKTNPHISQRCSYTAIPFSRNKNPSGTNKSGQTLKTPSEDMKSGINRKESNINGSQIWIMCEKCKTLLAVSQCNQFDNYCYHRQSLIPSEETTFINRKEGG